VVRIRTLSNIAVSFFLYRIVRLVLNFVTRCNRNNVMI
jgi:hypothetical protein